VVAERQAEWLREAHREFERARGRVWIERVRVGLEYRRAMRGIDEAVARVRLERDRRIRDELPRGGRGPQPLT
jgi:hypothetical protein